MKIKSGSLINIIICHHFLNGINVSPTKCLLWCMLTFNIMIQVFVATKQASTLSRKTKPMNLELFDYYYTITDMN